MMPSEQTQQNIRVAVRCRPLNKYEREKNAVSCVNCTRDKVVVKDRGSSKAFTFDQVFHPYSPQIEVYKSMVAPAVKEILLGYNCTIFAYGQTGSGKTFTMTGERSDKLRYAWEDDPTVGIIPRALSHLFECLRKNDADFSVRVSFLEVYNEELFDLLSLADSNRLAIYDDVNRKGSVIVKGLREIVVLDKDNVHSVIERGLARRQTASTLLNAQSSRSHSIFTVTVHIKEVNPITGEELLRIGKLHLVDLGGSESIGRSGAVDKRAREAGSINQSLLTLGRVITALVDRTPHVPYRESKLTRLLQDSLGGKTKTSIIATISPSNLSLDETLSTLDYAHRAKNIENRPEVNVRLNKTDLVRSYNEELERLRRDLEAARTKTGIFVDVENYQTLHNQIKQQRERICELEERREMQENEMMQLQDMFSLTQSELSETRARQEEVSNELAACQADLEEKHLNLRKLKYRLVEEEHLRQQHEQTEGLLRDQAACLLTTARSAIGDVTGLHDKVRRLTDLEQVNRQRLSELVSDWTVRRLSVPVDHATQLSEQMDSFCQRIRTLLSDLRTYSETVTVELLKTQISLKQDLAVCLATECIGAAEQTDLFAEGQRQTSQECLETTLRPQAESIRVIHRALSDDVKQMSELLQKHNVALNTWYEQTSSVVQLITALAKESTDFALSQQQSHNELQALWDSHCSCQDQMIQAVQSALLNFNRDDDKCRQQIRSKFSSERQYLANWKDSHNAQLDGLKGRLLGSNEAIINEQRAFHLAGEGNLEIVSSDIRSLTDEHDKLQTKVDGCLDLLCKQASTFSVDGFGAKLRQQSEFWKHPELAHASTDTKHASVQLDHLVSSVHRGMTDLSERITEKALTMENLNGDLLYQVSTGFSTLKSDLESIPTEMSKQLSDNLSPYSPTGRTPQPKVFSYPEKLAQTASDTRLRRAFRAVQLDSTLERILTPLPHEKSLGTIEEFSSSPSLHSQSEQCSDRQGSRTSATSLGSESVASGMSNEQENIPIPGRIFPSQSGCQSPSPPADPVFPDATDSSAPSTPVFKHPKGQKKLRGTRK